MKNSAWSRGLVVTVAIIASIGAVGCAGSIATQEEIAQLETINMEIQSLEQQKANLQNDYETLTASISTKEAELNDITRRGKETGQIN